MAWLDEYSKGCAPNAPNRQMRQETVAISTFQTYPAAARQFKQVRCVVLLIELRTSTYSDILLIDLLSYSLGGDQLTESDPLTSHHIGLPHRMFIKAPSRLPQMLETCSRLSDSRRLQPVEQIVSPLFPGLRSRTGLCTMRNNNAKLPYFSK